MAGNAAGYELRPVESEDVTELATVIYIVHPGGGACHWFLRRIGHVLSATGHKSYRTGGYALSVFAAGYVLTPGLLESATCPARLI
jgi:hypothetical protein